MSGVRARLLNAWPVVVAALGSVPAALSVTPFPVPGPKWPYEVVLALLVVGLLWRTPPAERPAPTLRALVVRSAFGAFAIGVATGCHILAGGGAFFMPPFLFIGAGVVLGALLGPIGVFERHAAARGPAFAAMAALLSGWAVFLALCVGWVQ